MATERLKETYQGVDIYYAEWGEKWVARAKNRSEVARGDTLSQIRSAINWKLSQVNL
jgi:hypothetical protein